LLLLLFDCNLPLYAIKKVRENQEVLELNGTYRLLVYVDGVSILDINTNTTMKETEPLLEASEDVSMEVNAEKIIWLFLVTNHNLLTAK
jgi:hypothetical protein